MIWNSKVTNIRTIDYEAIEHKCHKTILQIDKTLEIVFFSQRGIDYIIYKYFIIQSVLEGLISRKIVY